MAEPIMTINGPVLGGIIMGNMALTPPLSEEQAEAHFRGLPRRFRDDAQRAVSAVFALLTGEHPRSLEADRDAAMAVVILQALTGAEAGGLPSPRALAELDFVDPSAARAARATAKAVADYLAAHEPRGALH